MCLACWSPSALNRSQSRTVQSQHSPVQCPLLAGGLSTPSSPTPSSALAVYVPSGWSFTQCTERASNSLIIRIMHLHSQVQMTTSWLVPPSSLSLLTSCHHRGCRTHMQEGRLLWLSKSHQPPSAGSERHSVWGATALWIHLLLIHQAMKQN